MGVVLKAQGKIEEAVKNFKRALAVKPNYVEARYNLEDALKEHLDIEEAK